MEEERRKRRLAIEEKALLELREHMQIEDEEKGRTRKWHIGKEIPLALVSAVVVQSLGLVWGAATLKAKVDNNEKAAATAAIAQITVDRKQDEEARRSEDRIIVQLDKINVKLDRITEAKTK